MERQQVHLGGKRLTTMEWLRAPETLASLVLSHMPSSLSDEHELAAHAYVREDDSDLARGSAQHQQDFIACEKI